ncbi:phage tail spike protein [Rossellomorea sp. GCM10028870]|uniref:phage tail spike protein n=1 Tax=Rossellomorea sp. GCM10028870 TaxID=3273426 RepID=UPI003607AAF2
MSIIHILDHQNSEIVGWITKVSYDSHQSSLDNEEKYDFIAPVTEEDLDKIQGRSRLLIPAEEGDYREFIVYEKIDLTESGEVEVYSEASYFDLRKLKTIHPQIRDGQTLEAAGAFVLEGINGWELGITEYSGIRKWAIEKDLDAYDALKAIASLFDCEIRCRVTISGNKVTGRYVDFVKRVGQDSGKEIVEGKDLLGIKRRLFAKRVVTALICLGPKREDGSQLKITVTDEKAFQNWNWQGQHLVEVYEPESTDTEMTEERLTQLGEAELKKRITAAVEYEAEGAALDHIFGYDHEVVRLGDSAKIKDEEFNPPMYLDSRVIFVDRSIFDKSKKKYKLGEVIEYKKEDVFRVWKDLQALYATKVIKSPTPPEGKSNIIWIQTGGKVDVAHTWNATAGQWEKITPTKASEVGSYTQEEVDNKDQSTFEDGTYYADQVAKNAEDNAKQHTETYAIDKSTYTQKIQDIENELTEKVSKLLYDNNLNTLQQDIAAKAGLEYVNGQLVSKADKSNTYTKTEVENQLNSKVSTTKYTTDQDGVVTQLTNHESRINQTEDGLTSKVSQTTYNQKVSSLETQISQANTLIQQNSQQIQLKATKSDLDTLEGRVSGTESSLSIQAGLIESKVSQVEFDGLEIGGRNLAESTSSDYKEANMGAYNSTVQGNKPLEEMGLNVGDQVTFKAYIKNSSEGIDNIYPRFSFYRADGSYSIATGGEKIAPGSEGFSTYTATVPQSATGVALYFQRDNASSTSNAFPFQYKLLKVEKGNKATAWTQAPEDTQGQIDTITGRMSSAETKITQNTNAIALKASQSTVDSLAGRVSNAESQLTVQAGQISSKVSNTEFTSYKTASGGDGNFNLGTKEITTSGWYRIASNVGNRAFAKFTVADSYSGKHSTAIFNAGIHYGNNATLTLLGYSQYSGNQAFTKARIVYKSTYEPPYLELYVNAPAKISVWCSDNIQASGWEKVNFTTSAIPSGYTSREFDINASNVVDVTSQNTSKDTSNVNGVPSGTITTRITNSESSITQLSNEITSKVSHSTFNLLSGRVSNAESSITQQADLIEQKVSKNGVMSAISQTSEIIKIAASKIQFEGAIFGQNAKFAGSIVSTDGSNTLKIDGDSISINDREIFDSESTLPSMYDGNLSYPMISSYGKMYLQEITFQIPSGTHSPGSYIEKTLNISNYTRVAIPEVLGFFCHAVAKEWYAYENDSTRVYGGTDIMSTKIRISPHYQYTSGGSSVKVYIMIIGYR